MDLGEFQGLVVVKRRQQTRQTAGQKGFATTRGPHQQEMVQATGGNLQGPAAMELTPHRGQIWTTGRHRCPWLRRRWTPGLAPA
jgi:hypothetical protein